MAKKKTKVIMLELEAGTPVYDALIEAVSRNVNTIYVPKGRIKIVKRSKKKK